MDVAGIAVLLVVSLAKTLEEVGESLQTREHQSLETCICQLTICPEARTLAFEFSSDPHACRRNPWTVLR